MNLKVWAPTEVIFDQEVTKIRAEAENGWFGILPRHVDFVASLVPGILCLESPAKQVEYLAIDHGVLVKCGPAVSVSTRNAIRGQDLDALKDAVQNQFRANQQKEQASQAFEAKLEADLVRRLLELDRHG